MVGPVHRGLVAHGHGEDDVGVAVGQCHQALQFGLVFLQAGRQVFFAVGAAPGAAEVVHLRAQVGAQHHLHVQAVFGYHLQHTFSMQAAVVQAQQPPVGLQQVQVFADLLQRRVDLGVGALALAVTGVADGVARRQLQRLRGGGAGGRAAGGGGHTVFSTELEFAVLVPKSPISPHVAFGAHLPGFVEGSEIEHLKALGLRPLAGVDEVAHRAFARGH